MPFRWDTPETPAGLVVCRGFSIPVEYLDCFMGALSELLEEWRWEQVGTETPFDAVQAMQAVIGAARDENCMIGTIVLGAWQTIPGNMLPCDGGTYNRVDYPGLYAVLDPVFILDADTFTVPDLRGRVAIGEGQGVGLTDRTFGDDLGEESHQLTIAEMPSHDHSQSDHTHAVILNIEEPVPGLPYPISGPMVPNLLARTGNTGGDGSHNNMQPSTVLKYAIIST